MIRLTALSFLFFAACGASVAQHREIAQESLRVLNEGRFDVAQGEAAKAIARDPDNPEARVVRAIARYKARMDQLFEDLRVAALSVAVSRGGFNYKYVRESLSATASELEAADADLAVAQQAEWLAIELCPACWQVDWNHNGAIDERDARLLEIEEDDKGHAIPEGDPRRRPTFRFDVGDVAWARAMLAFQRAALSLVLAYEWQDIGATIWRFKSGEPRAVLPLRDAALVRRAKTLVGFGLDQGDRARRAYLAETDDDREWVPNPRQKSHPIPLPVNDALYETWAGITDDLRDLVAGKTGLDVRELAALSDRAEAEIPEGYLDIGRLLSDPRDLSFDLSELRGLKKDPTAALKAVFGVGYVPKMPASPIVKKLLRMKSEVRRGEDTFKSKLRYLFWIN
jgi:hypothetical protein